jgi:hypothetical protein
LGETGEPLVFDTPDGRRSAKADVMDLFTPRVMDTFYQEFRLLSELVGLGDDPLQGLGGQARASRRAMVIGPQSQTSQPSQAWLLRLILREFGWRLEASNSPATSNLNLTGVALLLVLEPEGTPEEISGNLAKLVAGQRSPPKLVVRSVNEVCVPETSEELPIEWLCGAGFDARAARQALA